MFSTSCAQTSYIPEQERTQVFRGDAESMKDRGMQLFRMRDVKQNIVFFDIDDTLLNTHAPLYEGGYFSVIEPIAQLYHIARQLGLKTVVITARPDFASNIEYTKNELLFHKFSFDLLYMRPAQVQHDERGVFEFKKWCRYDALKRLGGQPVFSIGDNRWDFGPYGGAGLWIVS